MIRRPPRYTLSPSSAASYVYKSQAQSPSDVLELADERLYAEKARRHTLALIPKTA
jgi:hypothetical protein